MKRRIFALLAALCLLAGCAGKTEPDAPAVDPAPPTVDPTPVTPTEPSEAEQAEARLRERIAGMSIEEKVGQMFFVRCPEMGAAEDVAAYHLGGLLLFGRDYKDADGGWLSAEELTAKLESYQAAAELPLFIGSDEEGGTVTRASRDPKLFAQPLPSPQELYAARGMDGLAAETLDYNKQLLALGINVNLAPVCDVSTDAGDFIYARSFGGDAAATSEFVTAAVGAIRDAGVAAVLKHFPGYGNNADTHTGVAAQYAERGDVLLFEDEMGGESVRRLCDAVAETCGGRCAVFAGAGSAWKYAIGQRGGDLRALTKGLNAALSGRGGGKPEFVQGSVGAEREAIESFFAEK